VSVDDEPGAPSTTFTAADVPLAAEGWDPGTVTVLDALVSLQDADTNLFRSESSIITVAAAAPTDFTTPLHYDSTAVSGGLYAWDGDSYVQIGGLIA
jgi:hypothetical protein